ncbi:MAG: hypothetical protein ABIA97_06525 [Candidatus Omnitrophota bacterium]
MIVPMKKAMIIVQSKDSDSAVANLRSLGVLHIEHQKAPSGDDIVNIKDNISLIKESIGILSKPEFQENDFIKEKRQVDDWKLLPKHIIDCSKRLNQLQEYSRRLINNINQWQQWGDFAPDSIHALSNKNIYVRLYQIPTKDIKKLPTDIILKVISSQKGMAKCVIISQQKIDIPFKEASLPKMGLEKMRLRLNQDNGAIDSIKNEIKKHRRYYDSLMHINKSLEKDLEFQEALNGMGQFGSLECLKGYIPYDKVDLLLKTARQQNWGISIKEPSDDDRVPTLIRNPRWISIINPVFKAIEIVPGYREFDISLWFLLFLSVFFGMLIGDAGYGAIFFVLTFFSQIKFGKKLKDKSVFALLYLFSFCTITWGVLSGTFFGQAWLPAWIKPILPGLRDDKNIQSICFFIGALHLSIGHLWRAIVKLPSLAALAEFGWICVLWGAFFLAKTLILGETFPFFGKWFFIIGPTLVVLFSSIKRNILKGIAAGLGNLLLNLVNSFTDVVSYVRLFAVGLATVAVADAFNKMAQDIGFNSLTTTAIATFILFVGHTLNIILGPMSVLVHGVRLNVLEFCNHIDVKWSGFAYKPLEEEYYGTSNISSV